MAIDLNTLFTSLGIVGGNTQSTNQYDFYDGIVWSDATITYNQKEFFDKIGQSRYDFFKQYTDERQFYLDVDDTRINDYRTFYEYAGEYLAGFDPEVPATAAFTTSTQSTTPDTVITFTNTSTGTEPISYAWDFGDGDIDVTTSPTHSYSATGSYIVTLTASNAYGISSATTSIDVESVVACSGNLLADMSDLEIYYKMDEDATDSSGNGRNGTAENITYTNGKNTNFASASVFNGSTSRIYLPDASYSMPGSGVDFSVSMWFYINSFPTTGNTETLMGKIELGGSPVGGYELQFSNIAGTNTLQLTVLNTDLSPASTISQASYNVGWATGQWYHAVGVFNGGTASIYVDGTLAATATTAVSYPYAATRRLTVGFSDLSAGSPDARHLDGYIDDFNLWNRALSPSEISQLAGGTCPLVT